MSYRKLGNTDIKVSAITFGAWAAGGWMWGGADRRDAVEAIRAAYDHGVTSIDTAPIYGQGESEEVVAEAIRDMPRDKIQILTKFGMRWDLPKGFGSNAWGSENNEGHAIDIYRYAGKESVIYEVEQSLRRLKTDYIDLYQIHWPDLTTPIEETFEAVLRLKEQGKILEAGVCNYNAEQTAAANAVIPLASNQVPYSVLRRDMEQNLVPYTLENNIGIIAYSSMERGLLTGKIKPGHTFNSGDHRANLPWFSGDNLVKVNRFIDQVKPIAEVKGATLAQLFLRWTVEQPGVTIALAGARNAAQAIENAGAMHLALSKEELILIRKAADEISLG